MSDEKVDKINAEIEEAKKNKSAQKRASTTFTDPQLSKGNQNNYVTKAEKALQNEANVKEYKEKKYEEDVSKEVGQIIIDDEQDIDKNVKAFMIEKSTQQQLAIEEALDEDKEEENKNKEQMQRQEIERDIKEAQEKERSILEDDEEEDELLEKEKLLKVDVDENLENENKAFYTATPTPKPGMSKPSKEIEELLKQGGDNLNNLLQKTGDDAGKILKENIALYNTFHQQLLNEPNATKRDGLMKEMQNNLQSNPIGDNTINASMNNIINDVIDIYDGLRRGDLLTNAPGIVSHNTTAMFGGSHAGSQETGSLQQVEQNKSSRSKLPTPIDINLVPPDGVNK